MRSIIQGTRYDTTTADLIGEYHTYDGEAHRGSLDAWEAGLYRTRRSRRYFLAGHGGPMTRFAKPDFGDSVRGGSRIIPMTEADARDWARQYLSDDKYNAEFGEKQ